MAMQATEKPKKDNNSGKMVNKTESE